MTWATDYRFSDPLQDLRTNHGDAAYDDECPPELRQRIANTYCAELVTELAPGHPLYAAELRVIARALPQDEVIVETSDGRVALVHMTWTQHPETPPAPTTEVLRSAEHLERFIEFRY